MSIIKLSQHFTLDEATSSQTASRLGIYNTPSDAVIAVMKSTATNMETVRDILNSKPITVSSWYRSPELNVKIGGVKTSQHCKGEAVDFICPMYGSCYYVANAIMHSKIDFDQLILEHTWVHISFKSDPYANQRRQVLSLLKSGGYANGLTDVNGHPYTM